MSYEVVVDDPDERENKNPSSYKDGDQVKIKNEWKGLKYHLNRKHKLDGETKDSQDDEYR